MDATLSKVLGLPIDVGETTHTDSRPLVIGDHSQILSICRSANVDRIIVAMDEQRGRLPVHQLLNCRVKGIPVEEANSFMEDLLGRLSVESLRPSSLIFAKGFRRSAVSKKLKRWLDVVCSAFGLVLSFPICVAVALAIKLDSHGPMFYTQERVGQDDRVFRLVKFRSMRNDAEENGPKWAGTNDDRVTRVGRFIRKCRLDEIPQMFNVLKGEMSFIGPRPERPFFVETLSREIPYYSQRHAVKPGISGWAQIRYPYGASQEDAREKLKYDLYYIKHLSLLFDISIIFETAKVVLLGKGAR
jgi:sugar transferase (PEP-CTERM system associated)